MKGMRKPLKLGTRMKVIELPQTQREVNGKLSFEELHDQCWGRIFDVLEYVSDYLQKKGLTVKEIEEVIAGAVENHKNHSMVIWS